MAASTALGSDVDVESFITEYYDAWSGTDEERIMAYYADNVTVQIPGSLIHGKSAVREQFVRPFITGFPGNRHVVKHMVFGRDVVSVECTFAAEHKGPFAGRAATDASVDLPGCEVYEYDAAKRLITAARMYFDVATLLKQIVDQRQPHVRIDGGAAAPSATISPVEHFDWGPVIAVSQTVSGETIRAKPLASEAAMSLENTRWYRDLAERESALQSSERNLSLIINTIPTFAWSARPDGYVDFLNQRWLDYTGMTAAQAAGRGWAEAIHPDDRKELLEYWQSCLASGVPVEAEARMRRFDASYRWFLFRANPLRDESGKIVKWYGTNIDIDDRKRGEESVRASELSWRQIVDSIPGLVATTSARGDVEFLNRQTLEYFGRTSEELKNWALIGAVHPDDLPRVIEVRTKSIESEQIYEVEHRCQRVDGVYRWFQVRGLPVRNAEGAVTDWYLLLTDIDDLKKAEEALRSNERNLSLMINVIPTCIYVLRPDGSVLYVNRAVLDYTGFTLNDVQKEDYRERFFHPEDVERLRGERREALARAVPFEHEQRVLGKDGRYRWFLVRYNPLLDEQGNIDRWYVAAFDIEDRKRAEEGSRRSEAFLAETQHLSSIGSFAWRVRTGEITWSEETYRIFELDPGVRVTLELIGSRVHPDDLPLFSGMIDRARNEDSDFEYEHRLLLPDHSVKHVHLIAHGTRDGDGQLEYIGAIQDVTQSKVAEEALNRARSELAHVARITTLNALTASIAHEVRQPLSGIITNAGTCLRMLDDDPPNVEGARETARRTIRDANRASDVMTRLRALFSKKEITLEPLDLSETAREVIALAWSDLQRNRVIVRFELADGLPAVEGDRIQLQQVILNLLRNASDAMVDVDDRPRELRIKSEWQDGIGVRVSIRDAGAGLPFQSLDSLFDAFYTTKRDGMGIGLFVSRSIIEGHHGRLWAEPNEGAPGTTFSFSIPCAMPIRTSSRRSA